MNWCLKYNVSLILCFLLGCFMLSISTVINAEVSSNTLAVIVNDNDAFSRKISSFYQKNRSIPNQNIIHVSLPNNKFVLSVKEFENVKKKVDSSVSENIQAFVLTWNEPYRVGCMSITSAFAFGFNKKFCSTGCKKTHKSLYYDSESKSPFSDYNIRPTMMLTAGSLEQAKKLVVRGVLSDSSFPAGTGYLVSTNDKARNVRSVNFDKIIQTFPKLPHLKKINANYIENMTDVMFYFTGTKWVEKLTSNKYLPGAIADHLTSAGGVLSGSKQMSILKWINAGVTGTYGTVREPCNYKEKFPNPAIVISKYVSGETLIEAYWKSVAWPGEGLFIGEPLAAPYYIQDNIKL